MADWREGSDPKPVRKPASGSKQQPAASSNPTPAASSTPAKPTDWRGRGAAPVKPNQQTSREWMRGESAPVVIRGVRRRTFLVVAAVALPLLILFFINFVFRAPVRVPLLVGAPTEYSNSSELSENPYSRQADALFRDSNSGNILMPEDRETSEQLLDNILEGDEWQKKYLKENFDFKNNKLVGGGPDGNLVCLYLSGYVVADRVGTSPTVKIVSPGGNPFALKKENDRKPAVDVNTVLQRIVDAVDPSSVVWVTLDLRPAPIVANFGDMHIPLYKHVSEWHEKQLKPDQRDRLIITLPCEDGQENWSAPELGSSVLAHFYRQCLVGAFADKSLTQEESITLAEAEKQITEQVDQWVRNRRFAKQRPQWIYSPSVKSKASSIQIVSLTEPTQPTIKPSRVAYGRAKNYWARLKKLQSPYRWAPVELGVVEAQLVHLHELAEASGNIETTEADIDQSLDKLQSAKPAPRNVSLIEDQLAQEHTDSDETRRDAFHARHNAWRNNPPWLLPDASAAASSKPLPDAKQPDATDSTNKKGGSEQPAGSEKDSAKTPPTNSVDVPDGVAELSGDQRCQFIVYTLYESAAEKDDKLHEETFTRQSLNWCLNYCSNQDWLELQFLRLLVGEVDWREDVPDARNRSLACAAAWRLFCELQRVSSNPRAEVAWWLRTDIKLVDLQFHRAVDLLVAADYAAALGQCAAVQIQMDKLTSKSLKLTQAIDARDEVFWLTPHALSWYLQRYRFFDKPELIEKRLSSLGSTVATAHSLSALLRPTLTDDNSVVLADAKMIAIADQTDKLMSQLQDLKRSRDNEIDDLSKRSKSNPQTIREIRLALRTPWLDEKTRDEFAKLVEAFLNQPVKGDASEQLPQETKIVDRTNFALAYDQFLSQLDSPGYKPYYEQMCRDDQRLVEFATAVPTDSYQHTIDGLYLAGLSVRQLALSFGSHNSYRQELREWADVLPWSAPRQFLALSQTRQQQIQVERLALAAWGDGDLANKSSRDLYFYQLATKYLEVPTTINLQPATVTVCQALLKSAGQALEDSAQRISQLKIQFQNNSNVLSDKAAAHPINFLVGVSKWPAMPSVYLGRSRAPWADGSLVRTQALDLNTDASSQSGFTLKADADLVRNRPLTLAFRGHFRNHELTIDATRSLENLTISFQRQEPDKPRLKVVHDSPKATKVVVMMDCSGSMSKFDVFSQSARVEVTAFTEAKRVTARIIEVLQKNNESHPVELGLVLFGAKQCTASNDRDLPTEEEQIYHTEVAPANFEFTEKLRKIVDELVHGEGENSTIKLGCTPLYNAIHRAVAMANGDPCLIYVVSDGCNNYDDDFESKTRRTASETQKILAKRHLLQVYQVSDPRPNARDANEVQAKAELAKLARKFFQTPNFDALEKELLNDLPRSEVMIYSAQGELLQRGPFGKEIVLSLEEKALPLRIKVEAYVSGIADGAPKNAKNKFQNIDLIGNEALTFEYREDSDRLLPSQSLKGFDGAANQNIRSFSGSTSKDIQVRALKGRNPFDPLHGDKDSLTFTIGLQHSDKEEYTPRPLVILGRLAIPDQPESEDYLVADSKMKPSHFPIIDLPTYPWSKDKSAVPVPYDANLTLWLGFKSAASIGFPSVILSEGERKTSGQVTLERKEQTIAVSFPQPTTPQQRLFVVCDKAERSQRIYDMEKRQETHTFQLYQSAYSQPVSVQLITVDDVRKAVNNNLIHEVIYKNITIRN